jgi:hypothetical protein
LGSLALSTINAPLLVIPAQAGMTVRGIGGIEWSGDENKKARDRSRAFRVKHEAKNYFASFSINFATMLAGTSS